jgi:hypothetical protein
MVWRESAGRYGGCAAAGEAIHSFYFGPFFFSFCFTPSFVVGEEVKNVGVDDLAYFVPYDLVFYILYCSF